MAEHDDEERGYGPGAIERARLRRLLHQIAETLGVPVAAFFAPTTGDERVARTEEQPQQADATPRKK